MEATKKGFDFKKFISNNAMWFVLIVLAIALTIARPAFLTVANLTTLFTSESIKGIITCGVAWTILSKGIDLGPGSVAALSAVIVASLYSLLIWQPDCIRADCICRHSLLSSLAC